MILLSKNNNIKRSLILAGGGVRLAYHAGVLKALEEEGLSFNHVDGTSGGIFGTAMLASGITTVEAGKRWRNLKLRGFMGILPLKDYAREKSLQLFNGAEGIRGEIFPSLGIDINRINSNKDFLATFNVCNFSKKRVESIANDVVTIDHLIAGLSLPMFIPATKIGEDWYTDSVWIKDANLTKAVNRGAEEIWLVWCIGNTHEYRHGRFNEYVHMIEISANAGLIKELDWIAQQNKIDKNKKPTVIHVIKPEYALPLDPAFFLKKIDADTLINMGYADTKFYLQQSKPLDFAEYNSATVMRNYKATLHFRQQFYGVAKLQGIQQKLCFRFSYFIRKTDEGYILQQFTSVQISDSEEFISGYNNILVKESKGALNSSFFIEYNNTVLHIQSLIKLSDRISFLLGLEGKQATITIVSGLSETVTECYQPAVNRLKNIWHLNIDANLPSLKKWKMKHAMLNYLFQ